MMTGCTIPPPISILLRTRHLVPTTRIIATERLIAKKSPSFWPSDEAHNPKSARHGFEA